MAVAGKIMPRPRGDYDPTEVYDIVDFVGYNNCLWLCRKSNVVGIEPNALNKEYWMLCTSDVVASAITFEEIDMIDPIYGEDPDEGGDDDRPDSGDDDDDDMSDAESIPNDVIDDILNS